MLPIRSKMLKGLQYALKDRRPRQQSSKASVATLSSTIPMVCLRLLLYPHPKKTFTNAYMAVTGCLPYQIERQLT